MIFIKRLRPIGMLVQSSVKLPIYERLSKRVPFRLLTFTPANIDWKANTVKGLLLNNGNWVWKKQPLPQVIYNRLYPEAAVLVERIKASRGELGIFNCITHFDKWLVYQSLQKDPLINKYLPKSYLYQADQLENLLKKHEQLILKPKKGSQGLGIWRIQQLENQSYALYHDFDFPAQLPNAQVTLALINYLIKPEKYFIQEYIVLQTIAGQYFDIRALVQKNASGHWQVTAYLSRIAKKNYFVTNISQQSLESFILLQQLQLPAFLIINTIEQISIEIAKNLEQSYGHLGEIGVDFGLDQHNQPWIIEINGKPNKQLFQEIGPQRVLDNIYLQPILYAQSLNR